MSPSDKTIITVIRDDLKMKDKLKLLVNERCLFYCPKFPQQSK